MIRSQTVRLTAALAIAAVLVVSSCGKREGPASDGDVLAISSGEGVVVQFSNRPVAPPALALVDLAGQKVPLDATPRKVVLLNFWATWCGPCREEIPALVAIQDRYRDYVTIVGLSIDEGDPADVAAFAKKFSVNYPVVMASEAVQRDFGGISSVPSTFVLDRDGKIVQRHLGLLDPQRTEHEIRALAGLPTRATVERVEDTGQVLLANAAYATSIPGVDFGTMSPVEKQKALQRLNEESCTCGCGLTLAQCRIHDPSCEISLPAARKLVEEMQKQRR
jgi:cytochrome c biogenesis protein CcmG/thiol:disulfide interchange protein DsbE